MTDTNHREVVLNNNSYISLGIVVMIIVGTLWIKDGQANSDAASRSVAVELAHYKELEGERIIALTSIVTLATQDRWTVRDQRIFTHQLKELNTTLRVPEIP